MKLEIKKDRSGKYFWRVLARNGKILCHSESYSSKAKAEQTFKKIIEAFK